jgi:WD40 repeat protein
LNYRFPDPHWVPAPFYTTDALRFLAENIDEGEFEPLREQVKRWNVRWMECSVPRDVFACLDSENNIRVFREENWNDPILIYGGKIASEAITLSPDGSLIAFYITDSIPKGIVRVFHTQSAREIFTLRHYLISIDSVRFSRDGRKLIAAGKGISENVEVVIWDAGK